MNHLIDRSANVLATNDGPSLTRRDLLRALGVGGAALAAGTAGALTTPFGRFAASAKDETRIDREIEQLAFDLDLDPETIFRFVADEVRYDAYPGVLRGAKGTLWGLAGNSADQALLLADLLRAALFDVRFVVGPLDDAAAAQLLASLSHDVGSVRAHAGRLLTAASDNADQPADLGSDLQGLFDRLPQLQEELRAAAEERLTGGLTTIDEALTGAGVTLPQPALALPEREKTHHVWVQYRAGTEWIDLDPTPAAAELARAYATPAETLDELPEELFHRVEFRVAAEVVSGGKPVRRDPLTFQARSQDLVGVPVTVLQMPPEPLAKLGITIASVFGGARQWVPHLLAGETIVRGEPMAFKTEATTKDLLGDESSADGDTLAAWLSVDVFPVDGESRHAERVLFDRVGADLRAAGEFDPAEILPIELTHNDQTGDVYLPMLTTSSIAVAGYAVPGRYFAREQSADDLFAMVADVAHAYHVVRGGLESAVAETIGYAFFPNEPNVTAVTLVPEQIGDTEDGKLTVAIDLIHQSFGYAPIAGLEALSHPAVISGVLGHVAERATVGELVDVMPTPGPRAYFSAGRLFEEAARTGVTIQTLQPGATPAVLDVSPRAATLIAEALAAGHVVVVPERAVPLEGRPLTGWWQIDPRTGMTLDRLETGRSTEEFEYMVALGELLHGIYRLEKLSMCILAVAGAVILPVLIATGGTGSVGLDFLGGAFPGTAALCACGIIH